MTQGYAENLPGAPVWDEKRPPLHHACRYVVEGSGESWRGEESESSFAESPRLCQSRCATSAPCRYFSYESGHCRLHKSRRAIREVTDAGRDCWCGSSPNCPHSHALTGIEPSLTQKYVCSSSSKNQSMFPWPWFNGELSGMCCWMEKDTCP